MSARPGSTASGRGDVPSGHPTAVGRTYGLIGSVFRFVLSLCLALALGLVFSILIEWAGILFGWWPEQGAAHARKMLVTELGYLESDFARSILGLSPSTLADGAVNWTRSQLMDIEVRFEGVTQVLSRPVYREDSTLQEALKTFYNTAEPYLASAHDIALVFSARVMIIILALPLLAMVFVSFAVDGLCQRELRKAGGGRESATKFHHLIRWISVSLLLPFILYLSSPWPTHPNWVLLPVATLVAFFVYFATSNYKKYL